MILVAHDPDTISLPSWLEKDPRVRFTGPISEDGPTEPRENLRKRLGMREEKAAIVTFGGGGDPETEVVVRGLRDSHVGVFVATGPLARKMPDSITAREWFPAWPLAPWLPAFDLAVASGGYNTVTELGNAGLSSLLIPFDRDLDDQVKRAREAEMAGWAISVPSREESEIKKGLDRLLNDHIPLKKGENGRPKSCYGAERAAALLLELMKNVNSTPLQKVSLPTETPDVLAH
jgi:UDP:flavonoid glycosyltransferase YjiC (YdhE family)